MILSRTYIERHFEDILAHANDIEQRLDDSHLTKEWLIEKNEHNLRLCKEYGCEYTMINEQYEVLD